MNRLNCALSVNKTDCFWSSYSGSVHFHTQSTYIHLPTKTIFRIKGLSIFSFSFLCWYIFCSWVSIHTHSISKHRKSRMSTHAQQPCHRWHSLLIYLKDDQKKKKSTYINFMHSHSHLWISAQMFFICWFFERNPVF